MADAQGNHRFLQRVENPSKVIRIHLRNSEAGPWLAALDRLEARVLELQRPGE